MKKALKISTFAVAFVIAAMCISYLFATYTLQPLTKEVRDQLPGRFVSLSDGVISYQWQGPIDGEKVVLVHGLSTPKFVWDANVQALASAGFRVLRFDHFGRGFSDRPNIIYNEALYIRELLELLDSQNITEPVNLVGYSMGGANVVSFSAQHSHRVKQLILIAPAGFVPKYSGTASLVLTPILGDWLMSILGKDAMLDGIKKEVAKGAAPANMVQQFEQQFQYNGYLRSILSTMRHYPMFDLSESYEKVGLTNIPVHAIWGTEDNVVPFSGSEQVLKYIPKLSLYPVDKATHSVTFAQSERVNALLLTILKG
jgi:pimeloyl-ACP methyl ester carboxylesterase